MKMIEKYYLKGFLGGFLMLALFCFFGVANAASPSSPELVSELTIGNNPQCVTVSGAYAYVLNYDDDSMKILDVSDPANPSTVATIKDDVGGFNNFSQPRNVVVDSGFAYVAVSGESATFANSALNIINVADPANPVLVATLTDEAGGYTALGGVYDVFVSGNYAYITSLENGFTIVDITTPSSPVLVYQTVNAGVAYPYSVHVEGNYAYITAFTRDSLAIYDVSTPSSPVLVSQTSGFDAPVHVAASGSYAYVSQMHNDTWSVVDISTPASPSIVASLGGLHDISSTYIDGNYAYVTVGWDNQLKVIDISDPTDPSVVATLEKGDGTYNKLQGAGSVYVQKSYAYITSWRDDGLTIIKLDDNNIVFSMTDPLVKSFVASPETEIALEGSDGVVTLEENVDTLILDSNQSLDLSGAVVVDDGSTVAYDNDSLIKDIFGDLISKTALVETDDLISAGNLFAVSDDSTVEDLSVVKARLSELTGEPVTEVKKVTLKLSENTNSNEIRLVSMGGYETRIVSGTTIYAPVSWDGKFQIPRAGKAKMGGYTVYVDVELGCDVPFVTSSPMQTIVPGIDQRMVVFGANKKDMSEVFACDGDSLDDCYVKDTARTKVYHSYVDGNLVTMTKKGGKKEDKH
ncbi:MAG: hypothetical protein GF347_03300 [Candidatus Moranbacteria bacterium]|nr:hypothetical protein [Candidatus Moranbacteria bacterium]